MCHAFDPRHTTVDQLVHHGCPAHRDARRVWGQLDRGSRKQATHIDPRGRSQRRACSGCATGEGDRRDSAKTASAVEQLPASYHEFEDLLSGTAAIYAGPATGPANVKSADHAFVTRVLVRAPVSAAHFSGSVWVEPFNTSGGGDFDAVWATIAPLIEERGDAWVGVTVRANQVRQPPTVRSRSLPRYQRQQQCLHVGRLERRRRSLEDERTA